MNKTDVKRAVELSVVGERGTSVPLKRMALSEALPVLREILKRLPWWRRLWFGLSAAIDIIDEFLHNPDEVSPPDA